MNVTIKLLVGTAGALVATQAAASITFFEHDYYGGARPAYWDVTYDFRGQDHRIQMVSAPGPTVTVNGKGEPRE